jgi:hypothetical protein
VQRSVQGGWSWAVLGVAAIALAATVLIAQAAQTPGLMDVNRTLTAGYAKALVAGYVTAVLAVGALSALLPRRLLWLPVAGAGALAAVSLAATLSVGGEAWAFAAALLTMGACWRLGNATLVALRAPGVAAAPPAAWLMGAGVLGVILVLLGRLGLFRWWTAGLLVIALGLSAGVPAARVLAAQLGRRDRLTRPGAAAAAIGLLLLALAAVFAAAPELMYDALYSKGWLPSEWARRGELDLFPEHPHVSVIGLGPLLAVPGHLLDAEGTGRYLQLLCAAGAVAGVWWLARRSPWAPVAAGALAITPHLLWQAGTAYDDAILTLAAVGLAAGVVRLLEEPAVPALAAGVVAGALAGACVTFKLHLVPLAAALAAAWWLLRRGRGRLAAAGGVLAGGIATAGPWVVVRWVELGNPVLPNYNGLFKSRLWPERGADLSFTFRGGGGSPGGGEPSALSRLVDPIDDPFRVIGRTVTETERYNSGSPDGAFGLLVVAMFLAAVLLWARGRRDRTVLLLWLGLLVAAIGWYQEFRVLRFVLPIGAVALAALALAAPRAGPGRRAELAAVGALAVAAAVLWPASVAQYWNVPGRDLPWRAALGIQDDYEYERESARERDAIAAFDHHAPPGATALSEGHQRLWLSAGRDLAPNWETNARLRSRSAPPPSVPLLERYRALGVTWILGRRGTGPFAAEGVRDLLAAHGELRWADHGWVLYRLAGAPRRPRPLPCDDLLTGRPGCWAGTLDERPGFTAAESATIAREVPVCAGRTLTVSGRTTGPDGGVKVEVDYDSPVIVRGHARDAFPAGTSFRVPLTAPPGTRGPARVTVIPQGRARVERIALGAIGDCDPAVVPPG